MYNSKVCNGIVLHWVENMLIYNEGLNEIHSFEFSNDMKINK